MFLQALKPTAIVGCGFMDLGDIICGLSTDIARGEHFFYGVNTRTRQVSWFPRVGLIEVAVVSSDASASSAAADPPFAPLRIQRGASYGEWVEVLGPRLLARVRQLQYPHAVLVTPGGTQRREQRAAVTKTCSLASTTRSSR